MEHGEDPCGTVRREVEEGTGHRIEVTGLPGLHSVRRALPARFGRSVHHHGVRLVHEGRITGGDLCDETGGSTGLAAWHPLAPSRTRSPSARSTSGCDRGGNARRPDGDRREPGPAP